MPITVSCVVSNKKGEVLICQKKDSEYYEFPSIELFHGTTLGNCLIAYSESILGVLLEPTACLEIVYEKYAQNPLFSESFRTAITSDLTCESLKGAIHVIIQAKTTSDNMKKGVFSKFLWVKICELDIDEFQLFGQQVVDKIKTCDYCKYIHNSKDTMDFYFKEILDRWMVSHEIMNILAQNEPSTQVYKLAYNQFLVHIRAFFIENERNTQNITVQNYMRLYQREDLATVFDSFFNIKVSAEFSLRKIIRETVDKYIVHYDKPTEKSNEIYELSNRIFAIDGELPIQELFIYLNHLFAFSTVDMFYYAGELGAKMDELDYMKGDIALCEYKRMIYECQQRFKI